MQEVEAVVRRVQSLAEVLSIDERHAQELATQEPRYLASYQLEVHFLHQWEH